MANVVGIDPSLTSSGYALRTLTEGIKTGRILPNDAREAERLAFIGKTFRHILQMADAQLVVIEGGSYASQNRAYSQGEASGVFKLLAWEYRSNLLIVAPKTLKKFVTGDGNAKKGAVRGHIMTEWGYNIPNDDEADAFGLLLFGEAFLNTRGKRALSPERREAISVPKLLRNEI